MTPIGHASLSYLVSNTSSKISLWAIIVGGLLPDVDYIFVLAPWSNLTHRAATHNLLFVGLAATAGYLLSAKHRKRTIFISLLIGGLLHLFADACIDTVPSNGIGVAIVWPFDSDYYFSPFNLVKPVEHLAGWSERGPSLRTLRSEISWEIPLYLISVVLLLKRRHRTKNELKPHHSGTIHPR